MPKFVRLLFMFEAYCNLKPYVPVLDCLSDPAKSTILILQFLVLPCPFSLYIIVKTA